MPDAPDNKPLVHRRDADGRMQVGPDWETLIDRQIREAVQEGKFDDLPHQGEPLPNDDNPYAGEWGLAFHVLGNAGRRPAVDRSRQGGPRSPRATRRDPGPRSRGTRAIGIARRRDHAALEELVTRINAAIARVNAEAPTDRQHRRPLALADEIARYDEACRR